MRFQTKGKTNICHLHQHMKNYLSLPYIVLVIVLINSFLDFTMNSTILDFLSFFYSLIEQLAWLISIFYYCLWKFYSAIYITSLFIYCFLNVIFFSRKETGSGWKFFSSQEICWEFFWRWKWNKLLPHESTGFSYVLLVRLSLEYWLSD